MKNIYPIIVPASYFNLTDEARKHALPGLDAFGIVKPLGNGLYSLLVQVTKDFIKNLHESEAAEMGLDRAGAERAALDNLSALVEAGEFQAQLAQPPSGFNYAVWLGGRFTSSCILWPGLHEWARRELEADRIIVSAPQAELLCVAALGTAEFRRDIQSYMDNVVSDIDKRISTEWFELTADGIVPLRSAD